MTRDCGKYEITVEKFLNFVHRSTERIAIHVVGDRESFEDRVKEFYLSEDVFGRKGDEERLLKYYKDVPLWNLHVSYENVRSANVQGKIIVGVMVANCHYRDIRDAYARERLDLKKEKQKAYRERKKREREGNSCE